MYPPSESLSLQGPRELLFIHLLLLLVDAGVGDGVSPVERRDSTEGMAHTVPLGPGSPCQGIPELTPPHLLALSTPKAALYPTQQLQRQEWNPQHHANSQSSERQQRPRPSLAGLCDEGNFLFYTPAEESRALGRQMEAWSSISPIPALHQHWISLTSSRGPTGRRARQWRRRWRCRRAWSASG